jgi:hypothetical protein
MFASERCFIAGGVVAETAVVGQFGFPWRRHPWLRILGVRERYFPALSLQRKSTSLFFALA